MPPIDTVTLEFHSPGMPQWMLRRSPLAKLTFQCRNEESAHRFAEGLAIAFPGKCEVWITPIEQGDTPCTAPSTSPTKP